MLGWTAAVVLAMALVPGAASAAVKAGVAKVDASWHVGAAAGQYASDGTFADAHGTDPHHHSTRRVPSYGVQSRLTVRAIVVEGPDGKRVALVKNDFYIPQDLIYRRTAQILEAGDSGITRRSFTMASTHNHSSPFYSSTSWGVWTFQDVFDFRFFDYYAKRMALAVERAAKNLVPVRVGATVTQHDKTQRNAPGPQIADDGTPAGFPRDYTDHEMIVVRFDDISDPGNPKPLANLVNYALHPEFLEGNDLISADYLAPLERMADRRTGALTIWTQGAVGNTEPEKSEWHSVHARAEYSHRDYAQAEEGARGMADAIIRASRDIEEETPDVPDRFVPFKESFQVAMKDRWFPGPISHPYPGVSNCRTDSALQGDPRAPVVGLPDCTGAGGLRTLGIDPGVDTDDVQALGIPVPENYSAPSYTGLEENVSVHLQALKLGDILLTMCSCEQWADQSKNIKTRTNPAQNDQHLGWDWGNRYEGVEWNGEQCEQRPDGKWRCPDPRKRWWQSPSPLPVIEDQEYRRMRAQINNNAAGWNDPDYVLFAESEPPDTTQIKGNYTHTELPASRAYKLTVPIGMTNDYNGYIVTYREYQRGDHYRKALAAWGPHSSDYMATRLVDLGGNLNGGPDLPAELHQAKTDADIAFNDARATTIGELADGGVKSYEASLPDDGGPAVGLKQPGDVERFDAAFFTWNGGSNFTDDPEVKVQRRVGGEWEDYADQTGELPVTIKFPDSQEVASYRFGNRKWEWTAHFEAFAAPFDTGERPRATPAGTYRFVVDGKIRKGSQPRDYHIVSDEFLVKPWDGIKAQDLREEADGSVSFRVGPRRTLNVTEGGPPIEAEIGPIDYPDSYDSPARFIQDGKKKGPRGDGRTAIRDPLALNDPSKLEWFCFSCTFRPWLDVGDAETAQVAIVNTADPDAPTELVPATQQGDRWVTARKLQAGEAAFVPSGCVKDRFGNLNGEPSDGLGVFPPEGTAGLCDVERPTVRLNAPAYASDVARNPRFPVSWTGTDVGGGIQSFTLEVRRLRTTGPGPWQDVVRNTTRDSVRFQGIAGATYEFRLRAIDVAGNLSRYVREKTVVPFGQENDRFNFSRGWRLFRRGSAWEGTTRRAEDPGRTMAFAFSERRIAIIAPVSSQGGQLVVTIDGRRRRVSLVRDPGQPSARQVVFRSGRLAQGRHRVKIDVSRGPAEIDAIGLSP